MPGPKKRKLDGQETGWNGHARNYVAVTPTDGLVYEPPLRGLVTAGGVVTVLLDADDENGNTLSAVTPSGTTPPAVTITGTPLAAVSQVQVDILVGGLRGTATFRYSIDGGATFSGSNPTAATFAIPNSGLTINFPTGTYNADNLYTATSSNPARSAITLAANEILGELAIREIRATGTTATNVRGFR